MTIGFAYDTPADAADDSVAAEYEDAATLDWIRGELEHHGHVEDLPWGRTSVEKILAGRYDVVFNITEGVAGRNRESLVPAVCELAETPCTGSDALALGIALDKDYTKILARHLGVPTPKSLRLPADPATGGAWVRGLPTELRYPVIVKPVTGGSSMGIHQFSKASDDSELRAALEWVTQECGDDALVEEFVVGREFVAGILDGLPQPDLPVAELTFPEGGPDAFYSIEWKSRHEKQVTCPASIPESTAQAMQEHTRALFAFLGLSDLCRADYRLAADGIPYFIEINPLPGLSPFYSIFPMQVEASGFEPSDIIDRLIAGARSRSQRPLHCVGATCSQDRSSHANHRRAHNGDAGNGDANNGHQRRKRA